MKGRRGAPLSVSSTVTLSPALPLSVETLVYVTPSGPVKYTLQGASPVNPLMNEQVAMTGGKVAFMLTVIRLLVVAT